MSIHSIEFTGIPVPTGAPVETPLQAAQAIVNGFIPDNLLRFSSLSNSFRDATISELLVLSSRDNKFDTVIETLVKGVQASENESIILQIYSEYLAAVAFAWEQHELAARVIMRNQPKDVSPFLWSIVSAIKKNMPSAMYASYVMSQGDKALQSWKDEATVLFGLSPQSQGLTPAPVV
jgi:hypothetical protein